MADAVELLVFGGLLTALIATSALVTATLRLRSPISFLLGVYVVAFGEVVLVTEALSMFTKISAAGYAVIELCVFALATIVWLRAGRPAPPVPRIDLRRAAAQHKIVAALAAVNTLGFLYQAAVAFTTPPNNGDALKYHLPRAALWLQQHDLAYRDVAHAARGIEFQPNGEIAILYTFAIVRDDTLAALPQLAAVLSLAVGVAGLARRAGFARAPALFAGLLVPTLSQIALQAVTPKNDLVLASFVVAAAYFVQSPLYVELVLAGSAVGLALGTKLTAVLALPVIALLALARLRGRQLAACAAALALGFAAFGAYAYVQSARQTGGVLGEDPEANIFKPDVTVEGTISTLAREAYRLVDLSGFRVRTQWLHPFEHAGETVFETLHIPPNPPSSTGFPFTYTINVVSDVDHSFFGPLGFLLVLPLSAAFAAAFLARRTTAIRGIYALALPVYALGVALTFRLSDEARFLVPAVAITLALAAAVYRYRVVATIVASLATVSLLFATLSNVAKPTGLGTRPAIWTLSRPYAQGLTVPGLGDAFAAIEERVPADARIGTVVTGADWIFPLYGRNLERRLVPLPPRLAFRVADQRRLQWIFFGRATRQPRIVAPGWTARFRSPEGALFARTAGPR